MQAPQLLLMGLQRTGIIWYQGVISRDIRNHKQFWFQGHMKQGSPTPRP